MAQIFGDTSRNAGMLDPSILAAYQNMQGIDASGLPAAGATAGAQYADLSRQAGGFSDVLTGAGGRELAAGQDVYNLGRDPMNTLHDYLKQQTVDASRAGTSARGIGMSANAAGLENDATRNFEMNWNNDLLARSAAGLSAMGGANRMAGADLSGAMGFSSQMPGFTTQSAMAPISAQQTYYGLPIDYANLFTSAQGTNVLNPMQGIQADILPYLGYGSNAGAAQFDAGLRGADLSNQFQTQGLQRLTGAAQGLQTSYNTPGSWLNTNYGSGYNANPQSYNSDGTFAPEYTGYDSSGGSAYG